MHERRDKYRKIGREKSINAGKEGDIQENKDSGKARYRKEGRLGKKGGGQERGETRKEGIQER